VLRHLLIRPSLMLEPSSQVWSDQLFCHSYIRAVLVIAAVIVTGLSGSATAEEASNGWIRGVGQDLQIRLRGEVLQSDGTAAADFTVSGKMHSGGSASHSQIDPKIDGHRFEFWIPVNQSKWYSFLLQAASTKGDRVAYQQISTYELREAAIDGIKLKLRSPTREVQVKVFEQGQPVSLAYVKATVGYWLELQTRTNADGIARFRLLPEQQLSDLMAWTDDFRIGGYSFHQKPARDPAKNEHVLEMSKCRDQKLRFLDAAGSPVGGVNFVVQMATPSPDYNYLGVNEHSRMTTNAAGEAIYKWFPIWDAHYFYVDLHSDQWSVVSNEHRTIEDAIVFDLKKRKIIERKRVLGRVASKSTDVGGFSVQMKSFQSEHENHSDFIQAFTNPNGVFSIQVLPDSTYWAYVQDSRLVSEIIDFIPYESAADSGSDKVNHRVLTVSEGEPVEVTVVSGPEKKPCTNMSIHFRREHPFQWQEKGEIRHGTGAADWWAKTDESGRAFTRSFPGKLKVSVYSSLGRTEKEVNVISGVPLKVLLHREVDKK
jgi:hypothetical protein